MPPTEGAQCSLSSISKINKYPAPQFRCFNQFLINFLLWLPFEPTFSSHFKISKSLCFQRSRGSRAPPPHNRSAPKCLILVSNCFQSSKVSQRKWIKQLQIFFHAAQVPLNKQRGSYSIGHNNSKFANFEPIIWVMAASNILRYTHCIDLVPSPTRRRQIIINNSQIQPMNTWKSSNLKRHLLYTFSCQAAAWFDAEKT